MAPNDESLELSRDNPNAHSWIQIQVLVDHTSVVASTTWALAFSVGH